MVEQPRRTEFSKVKNKTKKLGSGTLARTLQHALEQSNGTWLMKIRRKIFMELSFGRLIQLPIRLFHFTAPTNKSIITSV